MKTSFVETEEMVQFQERLTTRLGRYCHDCGCENFICAECVHYGDEFCPGNLAADESLIHTIAHIMTARDYGGGEA